MVDIHCHILPGVDDGARSLDVASAMVEIAAADGITHVVATPHCNARYPFSLERNRSLVAELAQATSGRLLLSSGCDFQLSYENLERVLTEPSTYTINQRNYLLVEFTEYGIVPQIAKQLHQLRIRGLTPIVTHPERNRLLSESKFRLLRQLIGMGCAVQVTAGSLSGRFGSTAQKTAQRLFDAQMVHLVASDAHDTKQRPPRLSEARTAVAQQWGQDVGQAVFVDNPQAVTAGETLPYFPQPALAPRRKRFSFF